MDTPLETPRPTAAGIRRTKARVEFLRHLRTHGPTSTFEVSLATPSAPTIQRLRNAGLIATTTVESVPTDRRGRIRMVLEVAITETGRAWLERTAPPVAASR